MRALVFFLSFFALLLRGDFAAASTSGHLPDYNKGQYFSAQQQLKSTDNDYWTLTEDSLDSTEEIVHGDKAKDKIPTRFVFSRLAFHVVQTAVDVPSSKTFKAKQNNVGARFCGALRPIYLSHRVLRI